jgi:hypothetical protein
VYTVGSDELRCIGHPPEQWAAREILPVDEFCAPPVLVQGRIHWRPVAFPGSKCNNMLVFDTTAESFRLVQTPVECPCADPFEMKGDLGLYNYNNCAADLWVLEDYENNFWSYKHRIGLQMPIFFPVPDAQGDLFVASIKLGTGAGLSQQCLKHLSRNNVATQHAWNLRLNLTTHRFKESLVPHDFFPVEGNGGDDDETPLFNGLSTAVVLPDDIIPS